MKHEADGLYYMTYELAYDNQACFLARMRWHDLYGERKVKVTLRQMTRFCREYPYGAPAWVIQQLCKRGYITRRQARELGEAADRSWAGNPARQARALMDALAVRAKREGRLPK